MITIDEVRDFQRAFSMAQWNLDLYRFAEAVNQDPTQQYTQSLFRAFTDANKALNRFDVETLTKILNAGTTQQTGG